MGTFSGEATLSFSLLPPINWGHLIKERICSHWSKFIPLREDPILGRLHTPGEQTGSLRTPGKQTGSQENCLPLKTWWKKDGGVPIYLEYLDSFTVLG